MSALAQDSIPSGYCQCGCGGKTRIARRNDSWNGYVQGQPVRFRPATIGPSVAPAIAPGEEAARSVAATWSS